MNSSYKRSIFSVKKHRSNSIHQPHSKEKPSHKSSFNLHNKKKETNCCLNLKNKTFKKNVHANIIGDNVDYMCLNKMNDRIVTFWFDRKEVKLVNTKEPFNEVDKVTLSERTEKVFPLMKYIGGVAVVGCFGNVEVLLTEGNEIKKVSEGNVEGNVGGIDEVYNKDILVMKKDKMILVINYWNFDTVKIIDCFVKDIPFLPMINCIPQDNLLLVNNNKFVILRTHEKAYTPIFTQSFPLQTFLSRHLPFNTNNIIYYSPKQICIFNTLTFTVDIITPSILSNNDLLQDIAQLSSETIFLITYNGNLCIFEVSTNTITTFFENCYGHDLSVLRTPCITESVLILNRKRNRIYFMKDYRFKVYKTETIKDNEMFICLSNEQFAYVDDKNELIMFEIINNEIS